MTKAKTSKTRTRSSDVRLALVTRQRVFCARGFGIGLLNHGGRTDAPPVTPRTILFDSQAGSSAGEHFSRVGSWFDSTEESGPRKSARRGRRFESCPAVFSLAPSNGCRPGASGVTILVITWLLRPVGEAGQSSNAAAIRDSGSRSVSPVMMRRPGGLSAEGAGVITAGAGRRLRFIFCTGGGEKVRDVSRSCVSSLDSARRLAALLLASRRFSSHTTSAGFRSFV